MSEPAFRVERIDHIALNVRNIKAAAEWYGRVLGLEVGHRWSPEPWLVGAGGTWLALFEKPQGGAIDDLRQRIGFQHLAFHAHPGQFQAAQQHLNSLGIAFEGPVDHEVAFSIYFNDPDGHRLEITCYPPKGTMHASLKWVSRTA